MIGEIINTHPPIMTEIDWYTRFLSVFVLAIMQTSFLYFVIFITMFICQSLALKLK